MEVKRVLYTATTNIHIVNFHLSYLEWFAYNGYEVHVACSGNLKISFIHKFWEVDFSRNPFDKLNKTAYHKLKQIIDNNYFCLIHCHTPVAGFLTRLAAQNTRKKGTLIFYTVHGFHFFKGSSIFNWWVFFPIEWLLSWKTDVIITINNEDFKNLYKWKFVSRGKFKTNGIGVNASRLKLEKYINKNDIRKTLGYAKDDFIILYIAEFTHGKNHQFILKAIPNILKQIPNARFVFAGGESETGESMLKFAKKYSFLDRINILGYQKEIGKYVSIADMGISASIREGLPIGLAEIMSTGLPVVITNIRGHNELVEDGYNGYLYDAKDAARFEALLIRLYQDSSLRKNMGINAINFMKKFRVQNTLAETVKIYNKYI